MTQHVAIAFDKYNNTFSGKIDNKICMWDSIEEVKAQTGFPYTSTFKMLFYEPLRNIYHIERDYGVQSIGEDIEEFQWIKDNLAAIESAIDGKIIPVQNPITMGSVRFGYLHGTDWLIIRHQDELLASKTPTLTPQQLTDVLVYRQALRDLSNTFSTNADAATVTWPTYPL
jgi:hypothetical protein